MGWDGAYHCWLIYDFLSLIFVQFPFFPPSLSSFWKCMGIDIGYVMRIDTTWNADKFLLDTISFSLSSR